MSEVLPIVYLARHGETAWTLSGQHTGLTDLPLTERGERNARRLEERLRGLTFAKVFTSPLQRASRTCELAGFGAVAEIDRDLLEWNYGEYEGRLTTDIHRERPDWQLFRDGCPGGESPNEVGARADRVVKRVRAVGGDVLLFSSGHFLRVFAARWLGLEPDAGRYFLLSTASLSALGYEHNLSEPVIRLWDDTRHVGANTNSNDQGRVMPETKTKILVCNAGSSSLKFSLFEAEGELLLAEGGIDWTTKPTRLVFRRTGQQEIREELKLEKHADAVARILDDLRAGPSAALRTLEDLQAVGHRVVHGGERYTAAVRITPRSSG